MPYSSGTYSLPSNSFAVPVTGTTISSSAATSTFADFVTAFSTCVLKDGTQTITANIPMASFKFTGLTDGSALTDSAIIRQVQYGFGSFLTSVAGTNTITATATPTPAYTIGQRFTFIPAVTNTGATTLNISSVGAGAVQLDGGALTGGELEAGTPVTVYVSAATPVFEIITGLSRATQAQQETGTSVTVAVSPGRQQFHPSASKGWCEATTTGGITGSYNVTSVTDTGTGDANIVWGTDFSADTYAAVMSPRADTALYGMVQNTNTTAAQTRVRTFNDAGGAADPDQYMVIAFGDQ